MLNFQNEISRWRVLGRVEPERLSDTRLNLHWAAQVVSAVGASYLPQQPDDSHTNLEWMAGQGVLAGKLISGKREFRAALRPYNLNLQVCDAELEILAEKSLEGMTYDAAIAWMAEQLKSLASGPPNRPLARDPYELPDHAIANGGRFSADPYLLKEFSHWFSNSDMMLRAIAKQTDNVSPVRCWPHHFDIAILIDYGGGNSIGIGMEPGDRYYDQPYWYVRSYPAPELDELPPLSGGGVWHREGWIAAVLTGSELVKASPGDQQCRQLGEFLNSAIAACEGFTKVAR